MCKKKEAIIQALKNSGMEDHEAIATEIEIGKISLVGCTTYREETNKALMQVFGMRTPYDLETARQRAHAIKNIMDAEKSAIRSSQVVSQRFYERLWRAKRTS